MKHFQSQTAFYAGLGIYRNPPNGKRFNGKNLTIFFLQASSTLLVIGFCIFQAKTIREYGDSFYSSLALLVNAVGIITKILDGESIWNLMDNLEEFIQKRSQKENARAIYNELSVKTEKVMKFLQILLTRMTIPGIMLPFCVISVFDFSMSKEDPFVLPYPMIWLFDTKEPFGYASAALYETLSTYCLCLTVRAFLGNLIGSCWLLVTFADDISNDLKLFDGRRTPGEYRIIFSEIMKNYSDARQYVRDISDLFQIVITAVFLWTVSTIGSSLVVLSTEISKGLFGIIPTLIMAFWSFGLISLYCEIGEHVTAAFQRFDQKLRTCNWYLFPLDLQRTLLTVLIFTQKSVTLNGYGETTCSRYALSKTVNGGFSYFMMLRQIAK